MRPPARKGQPVIVEFSIYVVDVNSINVEDMDFRWDILHTINIILPFNIIILLLNPSLICISGVFFHTNLLIVALTVLPSTKS